MSRGKHLSLEEARPTDQIDRFCKEHPSEGDGNYFGKLLAFLLETWRRAQCGSSSLASGGNMKKAA